MHRLCMPLLLLAASLPASAQLGAKSTAETVIRAFDRPPYLSSAHAAVVTGGNSGIGLESARCLLKIGCRVVLCSRDVEAGRAALASLTDVDTSLARVQQLNLADLESVREASAEIIAKDAPIGLLLNNAGVMATPQRQTRQGFELQLGTNHLGHHALTRLLLPSMVNDGRVVTVASTAHTMGNVDTDDLFFLKRKYTPWGAYGQSKAANILFAKGLADELARQGSDIRSTCLHPGVISTPLWRHGNKALTWLLLRFVRDKDVPQGAATSMYAVLAPELTPGTYLKDCAEAEPNEACADESGISRRALWDTSERLIRDAGLMLPDALVASQRLGSAVPR
mmetsp:Transcript_28851/g.62055  ORF Transcript_28851/g.62055 Transcript_28851/m.62055 type:complete len:339 (-) Transcript_28851:403-1419(-)